jgi:hypothetical protein
MHCAAKHLMAVRFQTQIPIEINPACAALNNVQRCSLSVCCSGGPAFGSGFDACAPPFSDLDGVKIGG